MVKPATPHNETRRLKALKALNILNSQPEDRFDRITQIACRLFDVPISLVSLVDQDRQWFKSRQGLDATETPRDVSFCAHAILDSEIFVVEDTASDERFCDSDLVTGGPEIGFYAGYPLTSPTGFRLGTLCIIDHKPRTFSEDDAAMLRQLGQMVEHELFTLTLATTDELTMLTNRRGFYMVANKMLALARRDGRNVVLMVFDLDNLKPINDTHGHAAGDRALADFASDLSKVFRESDLIARMGGDEFSVLLSDVRRIEAESPIKRLRKQIGARNQSMPQAANLEFTVGVARFDAGRHSGISDLYAEADQLMYAGKQSKKSTA